MKALIVDQDRHMQQSLEDWGFVTIVAENGKQAGHLLETDICFLVICNDVLLDMDILAFMQQTRSRSFHGYVFILVVIDATAGPGKRAPLVSAGADDFLTRPVTQAALADKLRLAARIVSLENSTSGCRPPPSAATEINGLLVRLLPGVVHEINNPVGFVAGNLSTMAGYIESLNELAHRFAGLVAMLGSRPDLTPAEEETFKTCKAFAAEADLDSIMSDMPALLDESRQGMRRIQELVHALQEVALADEDECEAQVQSDLHQCLEIALRVIGNELKYTTTLHRQYGDLPLTVCPPRSMALAFLMMLAHAVQAIEGSGEMRIQTTVENGGTVVRVQCFSRIPHEKACDIDPVTAKDFFKRCNGRLEVATEPSGKICYTVTIPATTCGDDE